MDIKRRNFLKAASGLGAGLATSEVLHKPVLAGKESIQAQSPVTTTSLSTTAHGTPSTNCPSCCSRAV